MKRLKHCLSSPLASIFEVSYRRSELPKLWSEAIVIPVFKKGNPFLVENYRPISLCCVTCKVMESIINSKISEYLHSNNLISTKQFGFSKGKSCLTQLLHCKQVWIDGVDSRQNLDVIFIDFSKAFDSVVHEKLLLRLRCIGFGGFLLSWITAFLKNRTQAVKIEDKISEYRSVTSGVPQGSVLGPTLFNIYVNSLIENIDCGSDVYLFADDVKIFSGDSNKLQNDLDNLCQWSDKWQLNIAFDKCSVLHLGKNNPMTTYYLGENIVKSQESVKDLGIYTTSNLSSTTHCHELYKKCSRIASLICKTFISKNLDLKLRAYKTYVLPILDYCSSVYNPCKISDINLIERIQRRFTKNILRNDMCYEDRLKHLNLKTLEKRRLISDILLTYKILHGHIPDLINMFSYKNPTANTRSSVFPNLEVAKFNFNIKKYSFVNRMSNIYNLLPVTLKSTNGFNLAKFKKNLETANLTEHLRGAIKC